MEHSAFFCEELLQEILLWLPVKSLVRFRCVSKSWNSTISDTQFIKIHLHRSSSTRNTDFTHLRLLISSPSESPSVIAENPIHAPGHIFCGTCNGLICLRSCFVHDPKRNEYISRVRLWNPATRSMSQHSPPLRFSRTSCWSFGFGYDSSTDTYKVVVASTFAGSVSWQTTLNVYNMGDDTCWRTIQMSHFPSMYPKGDAVYVNNTLNWLATLPYVEDGDRCTILSFDLGKESCAQLPLPYSTRDHYVPILGVLRDCLCFCQTYKQVRFEIWQMKEFGVHESWTRLFNIAGYAYLGFWRQFAMYMSEDGDALLLSKSGLRPQEAAVLYTQKNNKLEFMNISNDIAYSYAHNYIESLVSPCPK